MILGKLRLNKLEIQDILNIYELAKLAEVHKTHRLLYLYEIMEIACRPVKYKFLWFITKRWHLLKLNEVLKEQGLLKDVPGSSKLDKFEDFINYIAVRVNKTPRELKTNIDPKELEVYAIEVIKRDLQEANSRLMAHHLPKEYHKELHQQMRRLDSKKSSKRLKDKPLPKLKGKILKFGIKTPRMQPV